MTRKAYVDLAKFFAIFIVLMNHMELNIPFLNSFGGMFFVPVFFVLAGYTYHAKEEKFHVFVLKKAKRLLLPYLTANLFLFAFFFLKDSLLTGNITGASFQSLFGILYSRYSLHPLDTTENILFFPNLNSPTWFLTALFLTYLLFELLQRMAKNYHGKHSGNQILAFYIALCLLAGVILHYAVIEFGKILLPWSLETIPLFVVYMYSGYMMGKRETVQGIWKKPWQLLILIFLAAAGKYLCGSANVSVGDFGTYTTLGLLNGITSSLLVLCVCYKLSEYLPSLFSRLGQNTLHFMCYHLFVFMFLKTACNVCMPGRLDGNDSVAGSLKFVIIVFTFIIIQGFDALWGKVTAKWSRRRETV